jgi:hypothetical protein
MTNKGKITDAQIAEIKMAYPDTALFKWTSPNKKDEAVLRPITADLLKKLTSIIREAELQGKPLPIQDVNEKVFDSCVLWPAFSIEEKLSLPVGTIPSIVKVIQEKSGFLDIDVFQRVLAPDMLTTILKDHEYWGDISDEEVAELKTRTPFQLNKVRIGRWVFVVRPMTRTDIQVATQANDDQLALAKAVVMWPREVKWEHLPAGIIELLGRKANELSGWDDDSTVEEL